MKDNYMKKKVLWITSQIKQRGVSSIKEAVKITGIPEDKIQKMINNNTQYNGYTIFWQMVDL